MPVDLRNAFAAWRTKHARRAWKPVCVESVGGKGQFGGSPSMAPGEPWPSCEGCRKPMQFFLQLPIASLPAGAPVRGDGLLQLFYCSVDDGNCETWSPFSGTHLVRLLTGPSSPGQHPPGLAPFPLRSIERWEEIVDDPHPEEHEALGIAYAYDFVRRTVSVSCAELGVALADLRLDSNAAETIANAATGDKLGGWPAWGQSVEYPACPECGQAMDLVLQLDSEDNVPYMFGDVGCGHLTQCRNHPHQLAFGWAGS